MYVVNTPADFSTLSLALDNTKNSAVTQMVVKFTIPMPMYEVGSLMQVTFPS